MKIVYVTYHNWETKRHGGFHQFADYSCRQGIETVFFSFSRPYYIVFKHEERENKEVLLKLSKGIEYNIDSEHKLINITWPTFAIPGFFRDYFSDKFNIYMMTKSLTPFGTVAKKWLEGTDCFVFESCDAVCLVDKIKERYPNSLIVYRPSDPMLDRRKESYLIYGEKVMLEKSDLVICVNERGKKFYLESYPNVDESVYRVIDNGVALNDFVNDYTRPSTMPKGRTALFVGASPIDWDSVIFAASKLPDINFVLVSPADQPKKSLQDIQSYENIYYIPGIPPKEVAAWMTNADIIIQPIPEKTERYKKKTLSITAQNYKAMAAGKYIVSYMGPQSFSDYGIISTYNHEDFANSIAKHIGKKAQYDLNLEEKNWDYICSQFFKEIQQKVNER
jgi:hypothetical protein